MARIVVKSTVTLNSDGGWGAAMFIISPFIMSGAAYWFWSQQLEFAQRGYLFNDYRALAVLLMLASSATFLFGVVKLITGREYTHEVTTLPDAAAKPDVEWK